ncbi:MAG: ABC transporter permease [Clostridiales bacterium]
MIIFNNNLKRIFKKPIVILFMILVPVGFITLITGLSGGDTSQKLVVGVVDNDNTEFTERFIENLSKTATIKKLEKSKIQNRILEQSIMTAIILEKGITDKLINGKDFNIKTISLDKTNLSYPIKIEINNYLNAAKSIAEKNVGNENKFYGSLDIYDKQIFSTKIINTKEEGNNKGLLSQQIGFLVMSMLFMSSFATNIITKDKVEKTYYRVITGPIKISNYTIQSILSFLVVSIVQVFLIFGFLKFVMGYGFDGGFGYMLIFGVIFSLVCVAFGVAVSSTVKDEKQLGIIISLSISPMCMLGGCFWPKDFMPEFLNNIGLFFPTSWIMEAFNKILSGEGIESVYNNIYVLLGFAVLFSLFAIWKKTDIAK